MPSVSVLVCMAQYTCCIMSKILGSALCQLVNETLMIVDVAEGIT